MHISKIIAKEYIFDLISSKKDNVLKEMVFSLIDLQYVTNINELYKAVLEREKIKSTAIGKGIAIPHVILPEVAELFIAMGRKSEGLDFDSPDGKPVHLVIMIGAPVGKRDEVIELLAKLRLMFKNQKFRQKVIRAKNNKELLKLMSGT